MSLTARVFVLLSLVFLLVTSREPPWADAHVTYDTTQALVDRGELDVHLESGPPWFYSIRNGRKYGVFPLGNVIAMVPSYLSYKALKHITAFPDKPLFAFTCHLSPSLMMAGACAIFFHLLRRRGASARWALLLTIGLATSTLCFVYARSTYSESVQTLALMWLIERTLAQAERPTLAGLGWLGFAAGVLFNTKLVYALLLPFVAAYLIYEQRKSIGGLLKRSPLAILVFAELVGVAIWHNYLKTGTLSDSGYRIRDGIFSGDLIAGLYGFVLSSGKSLFLYSPPLILTILGIGTAWRRRRAETAFFLSVIAVVMLFNAKFRHWHADYCWGPRHLVGIMPLFLLIAHPWIEEVVTRGRASLRRAALIALFSSGIAVQLLGASIYWDTYIRILIAVKDQTGAQGWFQENLSHGHYIPAFSPLRGQFWLLSHMVRNDSDLDRDAPWKSVIRQPANLDDGWGRLRFDWWAIDWFTPGVSSAPKAALALLALLGTGVALSASGVRRQLKREPAQ